MPPRPAPAPSLLPLPLLGCASSIEAELAVELSKRWCWEPRRGCLCGLLQDSPPSTEILTAGGVGDLLTLAGAPAVPCNQPHVPDGAAVEVWSSDPAAASALVVFCRFKFLPTCREGAWLLRIAEVLLLHRRKRGTTSEGREARSTPARSTPCFDVVCCCIGVFIRRFCGASFSFRFLGRPETSGPLSFDVLK